MSAYDITHFGVQLTDPLRTAYGLNKPEYCVPKKGGFALPKRKARTVFNTSKRFNK